MVLAWVVPVFMLPFVNVLPFVHERSMLERLLVSCAGSALLVLVLLTLTGGRLPSGYTVVRDRWGNVVRWFGVCAGLALFTYMSAALSANTFGLITKALPRENFNSTVVVESAQFQGSRYRAVQLKYSEPTKGESRYLVLSMRLFDYPKFEPGDLVELYGKKTWAGVYVENVSLLKRGLTSQSSGPSTAAAHLQR